MEKHILCMVVFHNRYTDVGHILSTANFSTAPMNHQLIWRAIETNYPLKAIDPMQVSYKLNQQTGSKDLSKYLFTIPEIYVPTHGLAEAALLLLEIDIKEKYTTEINLLCQHYTDIKDFHRRDICSQTLQGITTGDIDLIDRISWLTQALKDQGVTSTYLSQFDQSFSIKIQQIKSQQPVKTLIGHLAHITNTSKRTNNGAAYQAISELLVKLRTGVELKPAHINQLREINTQLNVV